MSVSESVSTRTCPTCGKTFAARRDFVHCSAECRHAAARDAWQTAHDAALSLAGLERGKVFGTGTERRALCPHCDHPKRDREHATLAFNADSGIWHCYRCGRSGLLAEYWAPHEDRAADPSRPRHRRRRSAPPASPAPPREPSPEELAEEAAKREAKRRLWAETVPITAPEAAPGARYLAGRGIPLAVAAAAGVRWHADFGWKGELPYTYHRERSRGAVVFLVTGADGRGVDLEARYADAAPPKSSCTGKRGVFLALPGALAADGVILCEGPITALSIAACGFPAVALAGQRWPSWLPRRLAFREVFIALDEGESQTEEKAAALAAELARAGAKPYRLRLAPGVDMNDYLQAHGADTMRAAIAAAVCSALGV